jgi:two-component system sensor histidine kinase KdpD
MNEEKRPSPDDLLKEIKKIDYGKLTVFLGASAGVGKTFTMLTSARERIREGNDVVIGWVETHRRKETDKLAEGIQRIDPVKINYKGKTFNELDINSLLKRKPEIAIVDELAHTNIPGSRNTKRYQDIEELLKVGIDVYTTLNIQHLESLNDVISKITGIKVSETIPDKVLEEADIHLVDIDADALIQRLKEGKIYIPSQAEEAIRKFFRPGNINALREISLRYAADNIEKNIETYMHAHSIEGPWLAGEKVMVCINKNSFASQLIRTGKRMATSLNAELLVANINTPWEQNLTVSEQNIHINNLKLAEELGAEVISLSGTNIANEILNLAKKRNVTQIIIGKSLKSKPIEWFQESIVDKLLKNSENIRIHIVTRNPPKIIKENPVRKKIFNYLYPYFSGIGLILIFLLVSRYFAEQIGIFNITLFFFIPILITAFTGGYLASIIISIVSFLTFEFYFVAPTFQFVISDLRYFASFFIYLILALLVSYLSKRVKNQIEFGRKREEQLSLLYSLSRKIVAKTGLNEIIDDIKEKIEKLLGCKIVFLIKNESGILKTYSNNLDNALNVLTTDEKEKAIVEWVALNGRIAGKGTDILSYSNLTYFPLKAQDEIVGVIGISLNIEKQLLTAEQKNLIEAISGLIGNALYRVRINERLSNTKILEESQKLYNAIFNSISHDLRTPLTSIIGSSATLIEDEKILNKKDRKELILNINKSSLRMLTIVNNLLDMARIESGSPNLKYEWCDITDIIGVAIKRVENIKERELAIDIQKDIPLIWGDFSLLEQVFVNLLDNSVKYSRPGSKIIIKIVKSAENLNISITDNGIGVPEKEIAKIFDKFHRVRISESIHGTGLGLPICKSIIEIHKGKIWAESHNGKGLKITFTLPVYSQPEINNNMMIDSDKSE